MIRPSLARIVIDPSVENTATAQAIRRNAGGVEVTVGSAATAAAGARHLTLTAGKRLLLVEQFLGESVKVCQGLKSDYACCNLHTLAEANNCSMECTYCILQYYMTSPHLSVFGNTEELLAEVRRRTEAYPGRLLRIGTGELSDSLLLDPLTESTRRMVPFFRDVPNAVLELKTKTDNIENLLTLEPAGKTVVSWSVNPPEIVTREELKTASLKRRLAAARALAHGGYAIGFHIDPMIYHEGWREGYAGLVEALLDAVPAERIAWISIGGLRFPPVLKTKLEDRFPRSELRYAEMVHAPDGKMHYLRPLRIEMYRHVVECLRREIPATAPGPVLYLCMESPEVWKRVFDEEALSVDALDYRFAHNYWSRFSSPHLSEPARADYTRDGGVGGGGETVTAKDGFVPIESVVCL
jgi:spore photoproduct lyase